MKDFLARVRVILTAAPTWLTAVAVLLTAFADELAKVMPAQAEDVSALVVTVVAWIGAAINIIRLVTPVLPEDRGVLPHGPR